MERLRLDNEIPIEEQDKIMKSVFDRKNHRHPIPSPHHGNRDGTHRQRDDNLKS